MYVSVYNKQFKKKNKKQMEKKRKDMHMNLNNVKIKV